MTSRNSIPSCRNGSPNANRSAPYIASTPTVAISRPRQRLISALTSEPPLSVTTLTRPNAVTAKNSGDEKLNAMLATGLDNATITTAEARPPTRAATSE